MSRTSWIGQSMTRREDDELVRGAARFVDDLDVKDGLPPEEQLHMAVVRSTVAHARILEIEVADALSVPGVFAVVTGSELSGSVHPLPAGVSLEGVEIADASIGLLAHERVRYVGEPLAVVLASSKSAAEDAAELVAVDYDPLTPVVTVADARNCVAVVHPSAPDNVLVRWHHGRGDVDAAFAGAARHTTCTARIPRLAAAPIEVRSCVAAYDEALDIVTLWASAQDPWRQAGHLATALGRPRDKIRAVVPHVGGAFGSKGALVPEYGVAAWCAIHFGRTIRWFEDRNENLLSSYQGRGMEAEIELAFDTEHRITGLRVSLAADVGSYMYPSTANVSVTTASLMTGCYAIDAVDVRVTGFATTKAPTGPYRGAGRPEAAYFLERALDAAAREIGVDPVELRRRNVVPNDAFPYENGLSLTYDSGDYIGSLDAACALLDYDAARADQRTRRAEGRIVGVGVANYVERAAPGGWESAEATLRADGSLVVRIGSSPHGQGHETTFAQIAGDRFEVDPHRVEVAHGDSAEGPWGVGTFGSRSVTLGGSAVVLACDELLDMARPIAASLLGSAADDLVYGDGAWSTPAGERVDLAAVGAAADSAGTLLRAASRFTIDRPVFSFGTYAAVVEIDPDTGKVTIERIVAVDDAGVLINPLLAEGQVIGSSVQGIGAALFEEVVHDDEGQPLSSSFASYGLPSAPDLHLEFSSTFRCTPSPLNPLGAKGLGEAGTIGVPAAVTNAVLDALAPYGGGGIDPPFSPEKVWRVITG